MHPVGPLNSKVYWVRRVSIVVLAVAVLIGLVWFLVSRTSRSSAGQDSAAAAVNTSAAPTLTGVLAASSGASQLDRASPSPSPTVSPSACVPAASPHRPARRRASPSIPPPRPPPPRQPPQPRRRRSRAAAAPAAAAPATELRPPRPRRRRRRRPGAGTAGAVVRRAGQVDLPGQRCRRHRHHRDAPTSPPAVSRPRHGGHEHRHRGLPAGRFRHAAGLHRAPLPTAAASGRRSTASPEREPRSGSSTPGQTLKYTVKGRERRRSPAVPAIASVVPAGTTPSSRSWAGCRSPPAVFAITG